VGKSRKIVGTRSRRDKEGRDKEGRDKPDPYVPNTIRPNAIRPNAIRVGAGLVPALLPFPFFPFPASCAGSNRERHPPMRTSENRHFSQCELMHGSPKMTPGVN